MAGDWIKMRIDLQSHPKIVRILSETDSDKFRVVGGLHAVWSIFDTHSEDGILKGYSIKALDHVIGWDGFSASLIQAGWLQEIDGGLVMPGFGEHNGKSAKRRAEDQKRKRDARNGPQDVRNPSGDEEDEDGTREEKRREDLKEKELCPQQAEDGTHKFRFADIQDAYNRICPPKLPACRAATNARKQQVKQMVDLEFNGKRPFREHGLTMWESYFSDCLTNKHWIGENDSGWRADFDFVTKPKNAIKLLERLCD